MPAEMNAEHSYSAVMKTSKQNQNQQTAPNTLAPANFFSFRLPFHSPQGQITACPKFHSIEGAHRKVPVSQTKAALCYSFPGTAVEFN